MNSATMTGKANGVQINVPFSDSVEQHLVIGVGACRLNIVPAEGDGYSNGVSNGVTNTWVTGTYYGPIEALPLEISQIGGRAEIRQTQDWAQIGHLFNGVPTLELTLGKAAPYALTIETGASESFLNLGGLPLTHFELKQGAGKVVADFPVPNPQQMDRLAISTGASGIEFSNIANTNFAEMVVDGGAASYKLDFGGVLTRDAHVKVTSALSSTEVSIPASTAARITAQLIMGGLNVGDGFTKQDEAILTAPAVAGVRPMLTVQVTLTMGSLSLHSR